MCAGPGSIQSLPDAAVVAARQALDRPGVLLEPRAQWPSGISGSVFRWSGQGIADKPEPGRVLGRLTDLGTGQRLRTLLERTDAPIPDDVLRACILVLKEWDWAVRPVAVAAVPSRRHPQLVASLAEGLPALGVDATLGHDLADGAAWRGRMAIPPSVQAMLRRLAVGPCR